MDAHRLLFCMNGNQPLLRLSTNSPIFYLSGHQLLNRPFLFQYPNNKRAATENIKKGFFDGTPYKGVAVLEVYKIENRILLGEFLTAASNVR